MTTAPQKFDGMQEHRLYAFGDAAEHFPDVQGVNYDIDAGTVRVFFEGHKSAVPMPMRDLAKSLCLKLPAPGNTRYRDSDFFEYESKPCQPPRTIATFRLGDAIDKNQR